MTLLTAPEPLVDYMEEEEKEQEQDEFEELWQQWQPELDLLFVDVVPDAAVVSSSSSLSSSSLTNASKKEVKVSVLSSHRLFVRRSSTEWPDNQVNSYKSTAYT